MFAGIGLIPVPPAGGDAVAGAAVGGVVAADGVAADGVAADGVDEDEGAGGFRQPATDATQRNSATKVFMCCP